MGERLKVYIFGTQDNGCGKYRMWSPAAALVRSGLCEVRREPDAPGDITAIRAAEIFDWADVVYTQGFSALWSAAIFVAARDRTGKKLIVDLDDNLWDTHPMNVGNVNGQPFKLNDHFSDNPLNFWEEHEVTDKEWQESQANMSEDEKALGKPLFEDGTILEVGGKRRFVRQKNADGRSVANFYLSHADAVTTTNNFLAGVIRQNTGQQDIHILPNCLDASEWTPSKKHGKGEVWIGWSGSVSHYPDMKFLMPVFDRLMNKYPQLRIQIMGSCFDYLFPPKGEAQAYGVGGYGGLNEARIYKWDECGERWPGRMRFDKPVPIQNYTQWMCDNWMADIGICPLEENRFNDAKSELKWCEYSMLGIPTIASKFGPYKRAIRHGEDGLLCGTARSWENALESLIESPRLRNDIAESARRVVLDRYDADRQAVRWRDCFESVIAAGAVSNSHAEGSHVLAV